MNRSRLISKLISVEYGEERKREEEEEEEEEEVEEEEEEEEGPAAEARRKKRRGQGEQPLDLSKSTKSDQPSPLKYWNQKKNWTTPFFLKKLEKCWNDTKGPSDFSIGTEEERNVKEGKTRSKMPSDVLRVENGDHSNN